MAKKKVHSTEPTLMPISVDVDMVRFEKNLLSIGFFGAHDTRQPTKSTRRIEQMVVRNGQRVKVAAEFRGSELLGLPSTVDRDKFLAFLKIVSEEHAKNGNISNPIRFTGYRLIKELGLTPGGAIYEEILNWGKRMADTTITSERTVYKASKKSYTDEVLHVFRSFKRIGTSELNNTERHERYEVVMEDWLLENLNLRYVIPEDFNAYKQLKRPTAKGLFGNLHVWFHASQGRQVEKDYVELCTLLNIQTYEHLSKIKGTIGLSLDELVRIKYLSKWDIQPMTSKQGYKIVLSPGQELLRVLAASQRRQLADKKPDHGEVTNIQQTAINHLIEHGVLPAKAQDLVQTYDTETIIDQIEYADFQLTNDRRGKIANPAGFIIYSIENGLPIPSQFITSRRRREQEERSKKEKERESQKNALESRYIEWRDQQLQLEVENRYPKKELDERVKEIASQRSRTDPLFSKVPQPQKLMLALHLLRKEVNEDLALPTLEEWIEGQRQISLF
ncbi:MAG: replication initiator protein A [Acidobacteriaceae bacterium]